MLTNENFVERLKQENLASKNGIADFMKNTNFEEKLRKFNSKVTSNNTSHAEAEKKLNDHITSYTKLINVGKTYINKRIHKILDKCS